MDRNTCIAALSALGHESRLDGFRLLVRAGDAGLPAGEIAQRLGVRQNTMSTHLAILHQAGLVRSAREGRTIRYFLNGDGIRGLLGFLLQDCCGGRPELCNFVIDEIACGC
jgi:DNA-binding transcriptional ArsR family regulator